MTLRRVFVGVSLAFGLSVWSWCRADGNPVQAGPAGPVAYAAEAAPESGQGNHDEAAARYRGNQSRHWRHVMIGGR